MRMNLCNGKLILEMKKMEYENIKEKLKKLTIYDTSEILYKDEGLR